MWHRFRKSAGLGEEDSGADIVLELKDKVGVAAGVIADLRVCANTTAVTPAQRQPDVNVSGYGFGRHASTAQSRRETGPASKALPRFGSGHGPRASGWPGAGEHLQRVLGHAELKIALGLEHELLAADTVVSVHNVEAPAGKCVAGKPRHNASCSGRYTPI